MRPLVRGVVVVVCLLTPFAAAAQEKGTIEGFGGLSLNAVPSQSPPSIGGTATFSLTPNIQVVGEGGRIGNVLPTMANEVFSATQLDLRASALYGAGGVRLTLAPNSAVTPYGETTAGVARL